MKVKKLAVLPDISTISRGVGQIKITVMLQIPEWGREKCICPLQLTSFRGSAIPAKTLLQNSPRGCMWLHTRILSGTQTVWISDGGNTMHMLLTWILLLVKVIEKTVRKSL